MPEREQPAPATKSQHDSPSGAQFATAASVFALLADPTRLHVLWALAQGESDVTGLAERTGAARTAVSQHLAKLRLAGLVQPRREGRRAVYSLTDGHLRRLVVEALSRADHQVTGEPWHA
ncbi:metalloregulator ArsR/SmtB family transcription factor [Glycomyces sp. YM15]|uniref:ArsR/SmtB family transcription factor n=1 Tax=Glycomyces sp. YM15 TaxID=2800446 RepID=UPI0019660311|nr:metalloregulator ArsR/SmtB family transcription factor [Glycomyces sp. YM15]